MVGSSATTPTYTCGSETIKSYIFYIYSEAKLNLPKLSSEFMISPGNTNWYCIGT
jgi:hypothetical protein